MASAGRILLRATVVPGPVQSVLSSLQAAGYEAYLVGGAVRDLLLGREPGDWDIATSALPELTQSLLARTVPSGLQYGTVTVLENGMAIEVTTYRAEGRYLQGRKPSEVKFGVSLLEDLSRRDFTINAIAWDPIGGKVVDPYGVVARLQRQRVLIQAVGEPGARFQEDPLRMLRAISLAGRLGLGEQPSPIERHTLAAIAANGEAILRVSAERIRDELTKMLLSRAVTGCVLLMEKTGLLELILPEVAAGRQVGQGDKWHIYDVLDHTLAVVAAVPPSLELRLAALLHDVGKPLCRMVARGEVHFYRHDQVGSALAERVLTRLRYPKRLIEVVVMLVRWHMFTYPRTMAGARRLVRRVGREYIRELLQIRWADIIGSAARGLPPAFLHLQEAVDAILGDNEPLTIKDLAINGRDVMTILELEPGPLVGEVLNQLLEIVIDRPELNSREHLGNLLRTKQMPR